MANVGVVGQTANVTQSFHQQQVMRQRSERIDLKSPETDLGDVEADFQSLVNEMAKDSGSAKSFSSSNMKQETFSSSTVSKQSFSSSSSSHNSHVISTNLNGGFKTEMPTQAPVSLQKELPHLSSPIIADTGLVTAVPAQVIPDEGQCGGGESEVVVEKPMRVRDRVKRLEKQLSTEDIPSGPPEVLMPRGRSGSVKNLAEQFSQPNESTQPMPSINASAFKNSRSLSGSSPALSCTGGGVSSISTSGGDSSVSAEGVVTTEFKSVKEIVSTFSQQEESTSAKKVEGEFKSVKETASIFQEPIQPMTTPIRPPAAFLTDGEAAPVAEEVEVLDPVAVLPPATMKRSVPVTAPAKAPPTVIAPPQFAPIPCPVPVLTAPMAGPVAPNSQQTIAPEPASIYDVTPSPKTALTPTPTVSEPIAPVHEPTPVVPPREAKPTAPPPVPWRNTQEEKAAPPPAAAPKPAATDATPAPPAPKEEVSSEETPATTLIKSTSVTASESERVFEEALAEITKYSETLSQTSTESRSTSAETVVQQPIQYSAQVKCEVKSRVNTPELPIVHEQLQHQIQQQHQQQQQQQEVQQKQLKQLQKPQQEQTSINQTSATSHNKTEMRTTTSTTSSTFSSSVSHSGCSSAEILSSKAIIAKTAAKPPKFEPTEGPPKFSLLRSNSTGSMGSTTTTASGMKHAGSDKDLPKFSVKKVKSGLTMNASKFTLVSLVCLSFSCLALSPPPKFRTKHWESLGGRCA